MVLSKYDNKLLEFIYMLTRKQSYMNPSEVARYVSSQGMKVTDRTVRRWFHYLHAHHFDYFPYPRYEKMGLIPVWVLTDFNEKILEAVPYKAAIVHGMDFRRLKKCLLCLYLIPQEKAEEFKGMWSSTLKHSQVLEINSATAFYSPFHRLIDENGMADFKEDHSAENSYFTGLLYGNIRNTNCSGMDQRIKKNPLIIPIIWECFRKHMSSQKIWESFERRLGDRAWDYVNVPRIRREKRNGCGIRHVQNTIKDLHNNFHDFFQQIRIAYYPLYNKDNNIFYMILRLKGRRDIVSLSELLSRHSISMVAYPPRDDKSRMMVYYILTNSRETLNIISNLIQPYIDKSFDNKIIFEDFKGTAKYRDPELNYWKEHCMMSNYHKLFNPATCRWRFDIKTYAKKLKAAVTQR